LDRLKIIFQVGNQTFTLPAAVATLRRTVASDGFAGLWRGHSATLLRILPYAGLHYAAHEALVDALAARRPAGSRAGAVERFAAGAGAGAAATLATYPLDLLRARLAVASLSGGPRLRLAPAVLQLASTGGAWRGLGPTLVGIVPYSGATWLVYTSLRESELSSRCGSLGTLVSGALAGALGQSATYPLDVARRRMQVGGAQGEGSAAQVLARAVRAEGAGVLVRGLSLNWVKGPLATAVSFCVFDALTAAGGRAVGGAGG
jgi:solute carrier family 25 protein 42